MTRPGFLRNPMPQAPVAPKGDVHCGSFALAGQGAPWLFTLLHERPDDILIWMTKGQGRAIVDGVGMGLGLHTALYLPAETLFSLDLSAHAQALYLHCPRGLTTHLPRDARLLRIRDGFAQAELTGLLDTLAREQMHKRPKLHDAQRAYVELVGIWLERQCVAGTRETITDTPQRRLSRKFARRICAPDLAGATIAQIADRLEVTGAHLTRCCRLSCGKTATDMLTERRLHVARRALFDPGRDIQDIGFALGFRTPASFTRFVRTHTGYSPSELRRLPRPLAQGLCL